MGVRDPRHLEFIRRQGCVVPGCWRGPVRAHHIRSAKTSGVGLKPDDRDTVPMCDDHHHEGHDKGWRTFEARYAVDLTVEAAFFASASGQDMP